MVGVLTLDYVGEAEAVVEEWSICLMYLSILDSDITLWLVVEVCKILMDKTPLLLVP